MKTYSSHSLSLSSGSRQVMFATCLLLFYWARADVPMHGTFQLWHFNDNQSLYITYNPDDIRYINLQRWRWIMPESEYRRMTHRECLMFMSEHWLDQTFGFRLEDFAALSRHWSGHTPYQEEPTEPVIGIVCFTVGGKHHLYADCRYIANKESSPCLCDDANICLVCAARRLSETSIGD